MDDGCYKFESRRAAVLGKHGMVACGQPLVSQIGIDLLRAGGNAADAAVAMAAAMNVTQPNSTGIGGDAFCLYYDATAKKTKGLNGSGRSAATLTLEKVNSEGFSETAPVPAQHGYAVTVPGAAAAWVDTLHHFGSGKISLAQVLQPAIDLADQGFPVTQTTALFWKNQEDLLLNERNIHGKDMLINGRAPQWGQVFSNPHLANTFRAVASQGKAGFYEGRVAQAVVDVVQRFGGVMSLEDLKNHTSTPVEPISTDYKGVRLWEIPPNSQGIVALMTLNILKDFDLKSMGHNSTEYLHTLIEAVKLSFADALAQIADPTNSKVPVEAMLSSQYAASRGSLIKKDSVIDPVLEGDLTVGKDTIYLTVVDGEGNACSFINSNFAGFGSGIVPEGCGFTLQNRGNGFSLKAGHPNVIGPNKRPYHTLCPAMLTKADTGELLCSYGVMGDFMQPQGHVQVLLNMLEFGMDPQEALNKPRFRAGTMGEMSNIGLVMLEEGIPGSVCSDLQARGHQVHGTITGPKRAVFGRGHVITKGAWWANENSKGVANNPGVLWGGADPRNDGLALAF